MQGTTPITAERIQAEGDALIITLAERTVRIPWRDCSEKLAKATGDQRRDAELSPGGYGIHLPQLNEDLSVNGLVLAHGSKASQ